MNSVVLLVVLPFAGALIALFGKLAKAELAFSIVSALPLLGMAAIVVYSYPLVTDGGRLVYEMGGWREPVGIALYLDVFAWLGSALIVGISSMVALASLTVGRYRARYFFFLMLLVAGMQLVVLTGDIFTMFVGFEIVAISAYVLIAFDRTDEGLLAGFKYLMLSSVGILFFLFGVFIVYRDFGMLSLDRIAHAVAAGSLAETRSIHFAVAALCVGIGVRTAFIPFHTWLPEAHAYAPHPISALLSGVLIKVSFFAMMRIVVTFNADYLNDLLLWIGAATAILAVVWALAQRDAKRLLAYHSISQMGYVLAAFGAAGAISSVAAFSHAMHHALFKSLLFIVAGTAIRMTGERDLYKMTPIGRRAPLLSLAFLIGAFSIAGIPPFNGFASKQLISAALKGSPAYALLWITAIGTTASFIKISRIVMPGPKGERLTHAPGPGFLVHVPVLALAIACLATGVFARPVSLALSRLLSGSSVSAVAGHAVDAGLPQTFFSTGKLLDALPILVLGVALYSVAASSAGKRVAHRVERLAPELRTVLLFFVLGLGLFAAAAYL
ncbi:MAG: complex I subunit 5 family protein [Spirochaetota bacterium]